MECVNTHTKRFVLLPPSAFLCIIPQSSFRRSSSGHFVKLRPRPFWDIFQVLMTEEEAILAAVKALLKPSRKNREANANVEDEGD
jgi:hypothetical protein